MNDSLRIALVNDHPLVLEGLRSLLRGHDDLEVVELDSLVDTVAPVDLTLVDTYAQSCPLAQTISSRLARQPSTVAVFTWQLDQQLVEDALSAGARGVVSKALGTDELAGVLRRLAAGEQVVAGASPTGRADLAPGDDRPTADDQQPSSSTRGSWPGREAGLSMREAEMITLICQGLSNEQIANNLYLSPNSVKSYIRGAYHKIGVQTRAQAVIWGMENGMRPTPARA